MGNRGNSKDVKFTLANYRIDRSNEPFLQIMSKLRDILRLLERPQSLYNFPILAYFILSYYLNCFHSYSLLNITLLHNLRGPNIRATILGLATVGQNLSKLTNCISPTPYNWQVPNIRNAGQSLASIHFPAMLRSIIFVN